ncbi:phage tail-collar fiber domain-containing protein [Halomonas sp. AOP43-D1-4]|uniref:phage tail-collar fiber domain-containing protein n=1 Tax=Halomonas sp. AOP43-D1-4 TaxID=3457658 RepID=UPI0040348CBE
MAEYYTTLTTQGLAKVVAALSGGPALQPHSMAVGDGGGPSFYDQYDRDALKQRSSLVNQHWADDLNLVDVDPNNPAWVITEGLIPTHVGGWYIREVGIFDVAGDLIAIGVYPETYKPVATAVEADLLVRSILEVGEAAAVQLKIDPSQVMATRAWVLESAIPQALTMLDDAVERAEVARDIAQLAVGIFDTEQEGIDATDADAYFWVALKDNEDLVALYKNAEGVAEFYGTYSSGKAYKLLAERLNNVARASSRSARLQREFHGNNSDSPAYSMTDGEGKELITIERNGRVKTNPGPPRREFHTGRRRARATSRVQLLTENEEVALALDDRGQPIQTWIKEFHGNGLPDWGYMTPDGLLIQGGNRDGSNYYGGGNSELELIDLPTSSRHVKKGNVWDNYGAVSLPRRDNPALFGVVTDIFPGGHRDGYALLDQMQTEFPTYIDSSIIGHDSLGNEIREYTFLNPDYIYLRTEMRAERPTIVLLGNIHGSETGASASNFQFIWNLVYGWRNSEIMSWLRWNANIVFVPFICPDGYDNRRRRNPNNVDLNRNFPAGWEEGTSSYKGDAPGSELETQAVMSIPPRYPNAAYIGHHNFSNSTTQRILWIGTLTEGGFKVAQAVSDDVNQLVRREYEGTSEYLESARGQFRLADLIGGGMDRYIHIEHGCESYLLETRFGSWGPTREDRQQLGTRALEFFCKRICEQQTQFSIN